MNISQFLRCAAITAAIAGVAAIPVFAQGSTGTSGAPVSSFSVERVISTQNILSTMTPTFPQQLASGIQSGSLEARQSIVYDPASNTLTINGFAVTPGSPNPTPAGTNLLFSTFSQLKMNVDRVYVTDKPRSAVMFVGTLSGDSLTDPFGNLGGAPAAVSIGLKTTTSPGTGTGTTVNTTTIDNVVVLVAGTSLIYSAAGAGAVTFPGQPVTPPGSGSAGPVIVLNGSTLDTPYKQVTLSAAQSTDPQNLPISFQWKVLVGSAGLGNPTAAETIAQLYSGKGQYIFQVTATNSRGVTSTANVIVNFF